MTHEAEIVEKEITLHIVLNGTEERWHHERIDFEELVKLAFPSGPHGGNIRYSVTWTMPDGQEGSLRRHESVKVVNRMTFDVRNTDKS